MGDILNFNFNIPKIRRKDTKDNLRSVALKGRDASDVLDITQRSYLDRNYKPGWDIESVQLVENKTLEEAYKTKKAEMKEDGRHSRELVEQYAYMMHRDANISQKIAQEGFRTRELSFNSLGNSKLGVYLCKHADVQLRLFDTWVNQESGHLMVFKVTLGRSKVMNLQPAMIVDPTPNYDCHINQLKPSPTDPVGVQNNRAQIYMYEYDDDCEPVQRPRHCLPYAVITFKKSKDSVPIVPISSTVNSYNRPIKTADVKVAETNINETIPVLINRSKNEVPPQIVPVNLPFTNEPRRQFSKQESDPRRHLSKQERRELFERQHAEMLRRQNSQEMRTSSDLNESKIYQSNSAAFSKVQTRHDPRVKSSGTSLGPPQTAKVIKPKSPTHGVDYRRQSNEKQHPGMGYQKQLSVNIPRQRYLSGGSPSPDGDNSISDALTDLIVKNQVRVDALGRPMLPTTSQSNIEEEQQQAINQKFADEIQKHLQMTGAVDMPQYRPPEEYTPPPIEHVNQRSVQPTSVPTTPVSSLQEDYTPQPMEIEVTETSDSKLEKSDEMEFDSKISELLNEASLQSFEMKITKEDDNQKEAQITSLAKKDQDESISNKVKTTDVGSSSKNVNSADIQNEDEEDDDDDEKLFIADLDIESKKQEIIAKQRTNNEEQLETELLTFVSREDIKKKDSDKEQKKTDSQSKPIDIVVVKEETMDKNEQLKMQREKVLKEVQSMLERSKEKSLDKMDETDDIDKAVHASPTVQNKIPQDVPISKQYTPPLEITVSKQNVSPSDISISKQNTSPLEDISVSKQNTSPLDISGSKQNTDPSKISISIPNASQLDISISKQNTSQPIEEAVPQNTSVIERQEFPETENQHNISNDYMDYDLSRFSSDSDLESVRSDDEDLLSDCSSPIFYNDSPMKEDPRGPYDVQTSPQKLESQSDSWVTHSRNLFNAYSDHNQPQPIDPRNQPFQQTWNQPPEQRFYTSNHSQQHMVRPLDMNNTNQPRMMRPLDINRANHLNMIRPPINPQQYERPPYAPRRNEDPRIYTSHFPGKSISDSTINYNPQNPQDSFIQDTDYRRKPNDRYHMDFFKGVDVDYRQKSLIDVNPETGDVDYRRLNPIKPVQNSPQGKSNQDMMRNQLPLSSPSHPVNRTPQPYNQPHITVGAHEQLNPNNSSNMLSPPCPSSWGKAETIGHTSPSKDKKITFKDYKARRKNSPIRDESQKGGFDNILQTADLDLKNLKNILETVNVVSALKKGFHDSENDSVDGTHSPQKYIDDVTKMSTDPEVKYTGKMSLLNEVKDNDGLFNCYGNEIIPGLENVSSQEISTGKISISSILGTEIDMKKFESKDVDMRRDRPKITIVGEEGKQMNTGAFDADQESIDTTSGKMTPPSSCSSPRGRARKAKKNKQMMGYIKKRRRKKGAKKNSSDSISDITGETASLASSDWKSSLDDLVKNRVMSLEEVGLNHWTDAINHPTFQPRVVLKRQKEAESGAAELAGQNELKVGKEVLDSQPAERHSMVRQWVETSHKKIKLITLKRDKDDDAESVKSGKSGIMDDLVDIDVVEKQIAQDMAKSDDVLSISSSSDIIYQKPGPKCSKKPKLSTNHQNIPVLHKRKLSTDLSNQQKSTPSSVAQQSYTAVPSSQGQISCAVPSYSVPSNYSVPPPSVHITTTYSTQSAAPPYLVGVQHPLQPYQGPRPNLVQSNQTQMNISQNHVPQHQIQTQNQQNFQPNTTYGNQGFSNSQGPPYPVLSTMSTFQGQPPNFSQPPPNSYRQPVQSQQTEQQHQFDPQKPLNFCHPQNNQNIVRNQFQPTQYTPPVTGNQQAVTSLSSQSTIPTLTSSSFTVAHSSNQPVHQSSTAGQCQPNVINTSLPTQNIAHSSSEIRNQTPNTMRIPNLTQVRLHSPQIRPIVAQASFLNRPALYPPSSLPVISQGQSQGQPQTTITITTSTVTTSVEATTPTSGKKPSHLADWFADKINPKAAQETNKDSTSKSLDTTVKPKEGSLREELEKLRKSKMEEKEKSEKRKSRSRERSPKAKRRRKRNESNDHGSDMFEDSECESKRSRSSYSPGSRGSSRKRSPDSRRGRYNSPVYRRRYSYSPRRRCSRDRSPRRSLDRSPRRSCDRSPRRSRDRSPRRSRDRSPRNSQNRSPRRSLDRSPRHSRDRSPRRSRDRSPRYSRDRSFRRSRDRSPRRSNERSPRGSCERSPRGFGGRSSRRSYDRSPATSDSSSKKSDPYGKSRYNRRGSYSPGRTRRSPEYRRERSNSPGSRKAIRSPHRRSSGSPGIGRERRSPDARISSRDRSSNDYSQNKQSISSKESKTVIDSGSSTDAKEKIKRKFTETKQLSYEVKGKIKEPCSVVKNVSEKSKAQSSIVKAVPEDSKVVKAISEESKAQSSVVKTESDRSKTQSSVAKKELNSSNEPKLSVKNESAGSKEPTLVVKNAPSTSKESSSDIINLSNSSKEICPDVRDLSDTCSSKDPSLDVRNTSSSNAVTSVSETVDKRWTKSNFTEYTVDQINEEDKKLQEELEKLEEQKRMLEEEDKKMREEQARKEDERIRKELLELEKQKKIAEEWLELQKEKQLAEELAELERQKQLAEELIELEKQRKIAEELVELEKKKKSTEEMEELNKRKVELEREVNKPISVENAEQAGQDLEKDVVISDELDDLAQKKEELQKALADLENAEGESDCYEIEDGEIEDDSSDDEVQIVKRDKNNLSSDSSMIDLTERSSRDKRSSSRDERSLSRDKRSSSRDTRSDSRDRYSSDDRHKTKSDHFDDFYHINKRPSSQSDVKMKHAKEIGNAWGAMISHTDTRVERIRGDPFYQRKKENDETENAVEENPKPRSLVNKLRCSELITANDLVEEEERKGVRQELVTFADWLQMEYKISDLDVFKYQKYIKCVDLHSRIDENSKNKRKTLKKRLRAEMQAAQEQIKIDEMEKQNAKSSSSKPIRSVVISGVKEKLECAKDGDKRIVCDSGVHKLSEIERLQEPFNISRQKLVSELEMVRSALKMSWKIPKNKPPDNSKNESLGFGEGDYDHEFLMRHDLQQLEAEILMRINHFEFYGVPNRRVPDILLTKKEKDVHFSEEGIFLVLTASISHKAHQNLLSLKRKLESTVLLVSTMNPAIHGPQILKHLQDMEVLHQSRKAIMLTIAGYLTKKRFSKLSTRLKYYKRCMQYIQDLWKTELVYLSTIVGDVEVHLKLGEKLLQEQEKGVNRPLGSTTTDPYSIKVPVVNIPPPETKWREVVSGIGTSGTSKPSDPVQTSSSHSNLRNVELKTDEYIPLPRNVAPSMSRNVISSNTTQNNARIPVTINRPTSTAQSEIPRQVPVLTSQKQQLSQQSKLVTPVQQRQNSNLTPVQQRQSSNVTPGLQRQNFNVTPGLQRQNSNEMYTPGVRTPQESRIQDNSRTGPVDDRKIQNDPRYQHAPVLRGESAALSSPYTLPPPRYLIQQERQPAQLGEKSQPLMQPARSHHDKKLESDLMTVRDKLLHLSQQLCHDDSVRMSVQSVLLSVTEALDLLREESSNLPKVKSIILECLSRYNAVKELMEG